MTDDKNNKKYTVRSLDERYVIIEENIYKALSPSAMAFYMAMRFESDYRKECSPITESIAQISKRAKLSERTGFSSLKELKKNGLVFVEQSIGQKSTLWVSRFLNYFLCKKCKTVPLQNLQGLDDPCKICTPPLQNLQGSSIYRSLDNPLFISKEKEKENFVDPLHPESTPSEHVAPLTDEGTKVNEEGDEMYRETYYPMPTENSDLSFTQNDSEAFEVFWKVYPMKKNEIKVRRLWKQLNMTEIAYEVIEKLIRQTKEDSHFLDGFAPTPENYLKDKRWKDEIFVRPRKKSGFQPTDRSDDSWARGIENDVL